MGHHPQRGGAQVHRPERPASRSRAAAPRRSWSPSGTTGGPIAARDTAGDRRRGPHATMPPIVSDGQQSYPPADPTSLTADELAAAVGGRVVRAGGRRSGAERSIRGWSGRARRSSRCRASARTATGSWTRRCEPARPRWSSAIATGPGAGRRRLDGCGRRQPSSRCADTGAALLRRGRRSWRDRFDPLVVGVTGSLAKTSTKEQIAEVLGVRWSVLRNEGNQNNEVGLPLTLLRLEPSHEAAVLEMGLYVAGDIALLCAIARPSIGVVTAVRAVHLSRAGSLEAIGRASASSWRRCRRTAPRCSMRMTRWSPAWPRAHRGAGAAPMASTRRPMSRAEAIESLGVDGMRFRLRLPDRRGRGHDPGAGPALGPQRAGRRRGRHRRWASTQPTHRARASRDRIPARPIERRSSRPATWRILDDSYNAAPDSMAAALDLLADLPGRHVAVLGEMLELGDGTDDGASRGGRPRRAARGPARSWSAPARGRSPRRPSRPACRPAAVEWSPTGTPALDLLLTEARPTDTILLKASRGGALDVLVDAARPRRRTAPAHGRAAMTRHQRRPRAALLVDRLPRRVLRWSCC